jgi:membrane protein DedA with SNARE-associated domain
MVFGIVYHWKSLVSGFHIVLVELWTILACSLPDDVLRNGATILSTSGQVHVPVAIAIETLLMGSIKGGQPPEANLSTFLGLFC